MTKLREQIDTLIKENLTIKTNEKSEFGEVFTPIIMIETLYQRFPKNIWSNSSYTWLDPAGGIGIFHWFYFFWLMTGLKDKMQMTPPVLNI